MSQKHADFQRIEKPEKRRALVVGATGLVGSTCVRQLLDDDDYEEVRVWTRRSVELEHPKLKKILINFDNLVSLADDLEKSDLYCCLGTTMKKAKTREEFLRVDLEIPRKIARLALAKGCRGFALVSAQGARSDSPYFYFRTKGILEDELLAMPFVKLLIFRPGLLDGDRQEKRFGESLALHALRPLRPVLVGPLRSLRPTRVETMVRKMISEMKADVFGKRSFESSEL